MFPRSLWALCGLVLLSPLASAQQQPTEAVNSQDEIVNLDRPVAQSTDIFKILRSGNKAETNDYVTKVYPLKYANPFELLPYVRRMVEPEKGIVSTAFNPGPDGAMRSWIQVTTPQFQIPYIDAAIAALDVADFKSSPGDVRISYRTQYRSAQEVADFIRSSDLSPDGKIVADPVTNTVFLTDSPSDFKRVIGTLQFYDVPRPEIDLEVWMIELNNVDQTELGLDWEAWKTSLGGAWEGRYQSDRDWDVNGVFTQSRSRSQDGLLSIGAPALADFLNYLVDTGSAKTVLDTHVRVVNNEKACLESITDVPEYRMLPADGNREGITEIPPTAIDPKYEGVKITITPQIAAQTSRLLFDIKMRHPVAIGKTGSPVYAERKYDTDLMIAANELYRIGRLQRSVMAVETKGFPLLRDIPVLKYAFANEARVIRDTDMFLFVRPTWVSPKIDAVVAASGTEAYKEFPYTVKDLLLENPNVQISPEDQEILDRYFKEKFASIQKGEPEPATNEPMGRKLEVE